MVYNLPQIPYSCRTIFSSCIHPLSFFLFVRNTDMNIIVKCIIPFKIHNWNKLLNWLCTNTHTHTQGVSGGRSIFWEVMVSVILSKNVRVSYSEQLLRLNTLLTSSNETWVQGSVLLSHNVLKTLENALWSGIMYVRSVDSNLQQQQ